MLGRRKNQDYRSREYLTAGEVSRLLKAAQSYGRYPVRNYALVLLAFRYGLRVSEICEMRWDAISLLDKEIFITCKIEWCQDPKIIFSPLSPESPKS